MGYPLYAGTAACQTQHNSMLIIQGASMGAFKHSWQRRRRQC